MTRKAEKQLAQIKSEVRAFTSEMDMPTATEFMHELADWAYREHENLIYDDEPENQIPE